MLSIAWQVVSLNNQALTLIYAWLCRSLEQPFSFYERDTDKHQGRVGDTGRDPNRFQIRFKAKPIPAHVKEVRRALL
jgi:hypothetical protein